MIRSMTGYGRASGPVEERYVVTATAKSVNHRYLEVSVRLPDYLWELEGPIRAAASEAFSRGKLDVALRVQRIGEVDQAVRINRRVADAAVPRIREVLDDFGINSSFTAADLLRLPGFVEVESNDHEISDAERGGFLALVQQAFDQIAEMRRVEGEALRNDIATRLSTIEATAKQLEAERDTIMQEALQSYRDRVGELARSSGIEIDHDRLAQETVLMVEKSDVAEELTRLASHISQMRQMLDSKAAVGKKLDFLMQEMLREINTLGTKSRSAKLRSVVVELKAELERVREQVQNVE